MPPDPAQTIEKILRSAGAEFLQNGYSGSSLRKIAAAAGLTTGALYRHYADKENLYKALVEPVYHELFALLQGHTADYEKLLASTGLKAMWEGSAGEVESLFGYVYDHLDASRLLLSASKQTVYGDFRERLILIDVELTMRYLETARKHGLTGRRFTKDELYFLVYSQYSGFFEIVLKNDNVKEAMKYARNYSVFCTAGWKALVEG